MDSFFLHFNSESTLTVSELEARPQVLLIGQLLDCITLLCMAASGDPSQWPDSVMKCMLTVLS